MKLGLYRSDQQEPSSPSLLDYKRWLIQVSNAFTQALNDSDLVESCFWHHSKKVVNNTGAAALFYLMNSQDLIEIDDPSISYILKGSPINWFKLRRKALVTAFNISECNLVLAIRKIKASPSLSRSLMVAPAE